MTKQFSDTKIPVAEMFYSIQGEGPHAGTPAVFLRTAGCNLLCGNPEEGLDPDVPQEELTRSDDATWLCDTISVWRESDRDITVPNLVNEWYGDEWFENFSEGAHLVLTGGEPLIEKRQDQLGELLDYIEETALPNPFVEVETNGTIQPNLRLDKHVNQYNVSMKLSNSGMSEERRIQSRAIADFISIHQNQNRRQDATFKFVVGRDEDVDEVLDLQEKFGIPDSMIMLMPAGYTKEDLALTYPDVAEYCMENGWRFSPRLHVEAWGQATGV